MAQLAEVKTLTCAPQAQIRSFFGRCADSVGSGRIVTSMRRWTVVPLFFYATVVLAVVLLAGVVALGALLVIIGRGASDGWLEGEDEDD